MKLSEAVRWAGHRAKQTQTQSTLKDAHAYRALLLEMDRLYKEVEALKSYRAACTDADAVLKKRGVLLPGDWIKIQPREGNTYTPEGKSSKGKKR